jgi:hypothetical protein
MASLKFAVICMGISLTALTEATGEKLEIVGAVVSGSGLVVKLQEEELKALPATSVILPETVTVYGVLKERFEEGISVAVLVEAL